MKPNTLIELPDGRRGRVVYHQLDGYGVKFGDQEWPEDDLPEPDAMLRAAWRDDHEYEMVGDKFAIISESQ